MPFNPDMLPGSSAFDTLKIKALRLAEISALVGTGSYAVLNDQLLPVVMAIGVVVALETPNVINWVRKRLNHNNSGTDQILPSSPVIPVRVAEDGSSSIVDIRETLDAIRLAKDSPLNPRRHQRDRGPKRVRKEQHRRFHNK